MWTVVLKVLSILLLIILVLLGVCLLLLATVLFVPVVYRGNGYKKEEGHYLHFRANWLLGVVRFSFTLQEKKNMSLKVLWFDLLAPKKEDAPDEVEIADSIPAPKEDTKNENDESSKTDDFMTDPFEEPETFAVDEDDKPSKQKFSFRRLYDRILDIKNNLSYYADVFTSNTTKETLEECKNILFKVLRRITPKKLRAQVVFGFEQPDTTGKVFGIYCMFLGLFGKNVKVTPDFEKKIFYGEFSCKGKIYGITVLTAAIRLYFHKGLRRLITQVKKGGKTNGR